MGSPKRNGVWVFVGMLAVQGITVGMQLLSKVILGQGTFVFALMTYRNIIAAISVAPLAWYIEREQLKTLSWKQRGSFVLWLFFIALLGISVALGLFYYGLRDTTVTYAANFVTIIPIITFFLSTISGQEKLKLKNKDGKIKVLGAILCLAGAVTIIVYKGKTIYHSNSSANDQLVSSEGKEHWGRGTLFLILSCLCYSTWMIAQAWLLKEERFPYKYSATTISCIMATLQCMLIGLYIDRRTASWKLGLNLQLITIFYSGVLATAATFCLIIWAATRKGPTYPLMFNPLSLIVVAIIEAFFFGAPIYLGSLIGMVLIITGLVSFLLGKKMEEIQRSSNPA